jgi:hypothetical protein
VAVPPGNRQIEDAFPVVRAFEDTVVDAGLGTAQLVLVAFLVTFGVVRLITHSIRRGVGPFRDVSVGGRHLHHLVPGILLLLASGFVAIAVDPDVPDALWWVLPVAYGIGAALTLDEFALWLNLEDVYWAREGRRSIDAVIVASAVLGIVALGLPFWVEVVQESSDTASALVIAYHAVVVAIALAALLKGKPVAAAIGLLVWPVALVAAVRLARPRSRWARWFYGPGKRERSRRRFAAGEDGDGDGDGDGPGPAPASA